MGNWVQLKPTAVEKDGSIEVPEAGKSAGGLLDRLDLRVNRGGAGVPHAQDDRSQGAPPYTIDSPTDCAHILLSTM